MEAVWGILIEVLWSLVLLIVRPDNFQNIRFINYDVIKINKHSIKEVSAHDHFFTRMLGLNSARRSPPGLPASIIYINTIIKAITNL